MRAKPKLRLLVDATPAGPTPGCWGLLSEPIDPLETLDRQRAQSILSGPLLGQCPPLTLAQARDVLRWYRPL